MSGELHRRRILVTGAATGIGKAAVAALSTAGARVVGTYHDTPPPDDLDASWIRCDVCEEPSVNEAFEKAVETLGGLDVLVHAAGLWHPGVPGQIGVADLGKVLDVNLASTVWTNQAAYRVMLESGGRIINFGSAEGVLGSPISAGYAAAKAAVACWTRSIARAWAGYNITANALAPAVDTPGAQRLSTFLGSDGPRLLEKQLRATIPLGGKLGNPDRDLGPALVFLSSEGAGFITGQLLAVDGGLVMLGA